MSQRRREKYDISFIIVYFGDNVSGDFFTANFAQSGDNNVDIFFIKSDIYIRLGLNESRRMTVKIC